MATTTKQLAFDENFRDFACLGDNIELEVLGLQVVAIIAEDNCHGAPWDESECHGPVSGWTARSKSPGERVLIKNGGLCRYYDFAQAVKQAKKEGWGFPGASDEMTPGEKAVGAVEHDYEVLRAWYADEWQYCGIELSVMFDGDTIGNIGGVYGLELNYPGTKNEYLREVANELLNESQDGLAGMLWEHVKAQGPSEAKDMLDEVPGFTEFLEGYLLGLAFTGDQYESEDSDPQPLFSNLGGQIADVVDTDSDVWNHLGTNDKSQVLEDCLAFFGAAWQLIGDDYGDAGSDFHLTRNGHGAGFWDGDWEHGDELTELSKPYGTQELCCYGKHIDSFEEQGWEGPDACLETSFFEYGLIWNPVVDEDGDIRFLYPSEHDRRWDGQPTRYRWGCIKADCDVLEEFSWLDFPGDLSPLGVTTDEELKNWLSLPLPMQVCDLVNLFGTENVFGTDTCAGSLIHCDDTRDLTLTH